MNHSRKLLLVSMIHSQWSISNSETEHNLTKVTQLAIVNTGKTQATRSKGELYPYNYICVYLFAYMVATMKNIKQLKINEKKWNRWRDNFYDMKKKIQNKILCVKTMTMKEIHIFYTNNKLTLCILQKLIIDKIIP